VVVVAGDVYPAIFVRGEGTPDKLCKVFAGLPLRIVIKDYSHLRGKMGIIIKG